MGHPEGISGPSADDASTSAESPAAVSGRLFRTSRRPSEPSGDTAGASFVTPRETLRAEEIARARAFATTAGVFAFFVAAMLPFIGGDPVSRKVLILGLSTVVAVCLWFRWQVRRDEGYTDARANIFTQGLIFGAYTGILFFGVFSPAVAVIPFGLAFVSLGQNRVSIGGAYITNASLYVLLWLSIRTGLVPDAGIVHNDTFSPLQQVAAVALVEGVFAATLLIARQTRRVAIVALERHDRIVRSLAQRDALLREARLELAQAMQVGSAGRWTDEVVGGFRLGRVIGRGAMGEVYEATRETDGHPAAVKLLHPHVLVQPDFVQRFVREAKVVASLDVPNVVRVLEVSAPDARVPFLAMEHLVGSDLSDYLREHKRMGIRGVLTMLRQVGVGLDAARVAGIVHRDLKPRNLFLVRDATRETWKILDFGVARVTGEDTLTQDQIVGTPNYMAPEQANSAPVTHRTDLFALGVIAYRALTGHPAFEGETTAEILYKIVHTMPLRPSAAAPLNGEVDLALAIAIAKDPADRFASAGEMARALEDAAHGRLEPAFRMRAQRLLASLPWTGPVE